MSGHAISAVGTVTGAKKIKSVGDKFFGGGSGPSRDRNAEMQTFIDAVKQDKSISSITRNDLIRRAQENVKTFGAEKEKFTARQKELTQKIGQLESGAEKTKLEAELTELRKTGFGGNFDPTASELRTELTGAREGTAPKFKFRQALEKKRELMADRPGQKQLIFSRGR